ncbi:MAG: heparinase II/III family protein [Clostridiales bacterium]|nr:heparinase II/III family protein [Clostridiales bacterium]
MLQTAMVLKRFNQVKKDIRCMGPGEVFYRSWDVIKNASGIKRWVNKPGWMSDEAVLHAFGNQYQSRTELVQYMKTRKNVTFFFPADGKDEYLEVLNKNFPGQKEKLLNKADNILQHRFNVLGKQYLFDDAIDWHYAGENLQWPLTHWSKLKVDAEKYGDVRPLWELNRHQHFYDLGRAYWWTGDERYAREFVGQLKSWLENNPAELGINWQSNLEVAMRCTSWLWAFHFFIDSEALDEDILFDWIRAFIHSAYHLEKNISYSWYCIHNNHLIGEAVGLALIAHIFPELNRAEHWRNKALKILDGEFYKQVYSDGVNWEQSIYYHRFVLYLYLMVYRMEQLNGNTVPVEAWKHLEKMFDFLMWIMKPGGTAPNTGDNDDGAAVWLCSSEINDIRPALSTGAVLFEREDFKYSAGQLSEETIWLLGLNAVKEWERLSSKKPENKFMSFSRSGFYISRSGWEQDNSYLLLKNGPHADHAHADQLHIELYAGDANLLIDPGTYIYNANPRWRNYFRSTHAHNTVAVDDQSQSLPHRTFRWAEEAEPLEVCRYKGKYVHWIQGGHTGYKRLPDPVIHRRGVLNVLDEYSVVLDGFAAKDKHKYDFLFHFPPGKARIDENQCIYSKNDFANLIIYPAHKKNMQYEIVKGQENPSIQGWVSYNYGVCEPAPVFQCMTYAHGEWCTGFVLFPVKKDDKKPEIKCVNQEHSGELVFKIKQDEIKDYIIYAKEKVNAKNIITDGELVFYRSNRDTPCYLFSKMGTCLAIDSVVDIEGKWRYFELWFNDDIVLISGDILGGTKVSFNSNYDVNVDDGLEKHQISNTTWIIKNTG